MKKSHTTSLRAVIEEDQRLFGCLRIKASKNVYSLYGICGYFSTNQERTEVYFPHELQDVCFYGTKREFTANFRSREAAIKREDELFPRFLEAISADHISYANIPILKIGLLPGQLDLMTEIGKDVEQELPDLLQRLVTVHFPPKNTKAYSALVGNLTKMFPKQFNEKALQKNFYLRTAETIEERILPKVALPRPRVFSSPIGGMSERDKEYMRRNRRQR